MKKKKILLTAGMMSKDFDQETFKDGGWIYVQIHLSFDWKPKSLWTSKFFSAHYFDKYPQAKEIFSLVA